MFMKDPALNFAYQRPLQKLLFQLKLQIQSYYTNFDRILFEPKGCLANSQNMPNTGLGPGITSLPKDS